MEKKSVCCGCRLIGGAQCECCGDDGRKFETDEEDRQLKGAEIEEEQLTVE